jgi:hypothetical protein
MADKERAERPRLLTGDRGDHHFDFHPLSPSSMPD